ncbi:hypothetical protein AZF08_23270 [Bacillus gaemokensis]|nr:hypothetical protein AZF08_23270 [Bacillus gaemokensis]
MFMGENAFLSAIIHLKETDENSNIWSKTVCRSFKFHALDDPSYTLGQILEPSILFEVSEVTKIPIEKLVKLDYVSEGPIQRIQNRLSVINELSPLEKLNLAHNLLSISRYEYTSHILQLINPEQFSVQEKLRYYYLRFLLKNRLDEMSYELEFNKMKELLEGNNFPETIRLKIATQAIVWELKQKRIGNELFQWYIDQGISSRRKIKEGNNFSEHIAVSSFHRAFAMIPAEKKEENETREEMQKALYYANLAQATNDLEECRKLDAIKTCYESELKEHLYLSKNHNQAERAGYDLIATDPNWSISYHEMAEFYLKMNKPEKALSMFEKAKEIGLPRVTFTHFMLGYCLNLVGRKEESLNEFLQTLKLDSTNISAGINGFNIAKEINHDLQQVFKKYLETWEKENLLDEEHKSYLITT